MVEALTIVVAAGVSRGGVRRWKVPPQPSWSWRLIVAAVGVPLIHYVPIDALRVVVGGLLLVLGLSWLRKAILRASGLKALHDEDAIFTATTEELCQGAIGADGAPRRDGVAFAVAFKGVFLEGTEVVLIVVSLGASQHRLGLAAGAAGCRGRAGGAGRGPGGPAAVQLCRRTPSSWGWASCSPVSGSSGWGRVGRALARERSGYRRDHRDIRPDHPGVGDLAPKGGPPVRADRLRVLPWSGRSNEQHRSGCPLIRHFLVGLPRR